MPAPHPQTAPARTAPDLAAAARAASGDTGATNRTHLSVEDVSHDFGDRRVLSGISFSAAPGDRIGLIGENGTGKSTLLRIIAGDLEPDAGAVALPGSVGLLVQELPYAAEDPVSRVLDDAQRQVLDALERLEELAAGYAEAPDDAATARAYAEALEEAERGDAWSAEARRGETLTGLGLGGIPETRPIGRLSGGQRLRLGLAALLLRAPHTLLLDEPSNHLDDASAAYLERVLHDWPGIVIVASHDRALLDAVTTRILDLDPLPIAAAVLADAEEHGEGTGPEAGVGSELLSAPVTDDSGSGLGARLWGVGYSAARAERRAEMRRWRDRYASETEEREALVHEIEVGSREVNRKHESKSEAKITRKFYADKDARVTARRARNARVRLESLERERVRRPPEPLRFAGFAAVDESGPGTPQEHSGNAAPRLADAPVLAADELALDGRLAPTSFELAPRGRVMLAGPNGAGKSTLLAILAGELEADGGSFAVGTADGRARIGYLPQEVEFARPERTAAAHYREAVGADVAEALPLELTGLIAARDLDRPVGTLSVGQRRRLALAALVADPPPILLLDEPTNHLSLTLVEELEEALRAYAGALVIATHDRWLRSLWNGETVPIAPPAP
ncbi:ABC transporter ATP-binding protein [Leucobacter zeae]|nr:ABC transporter ATP-binding protein [Leucobacter zeae]